MLAAETDSRSSLTQKWFSFKFHALKAFLPCSRTDGNDANNTASVPLWASGTSSALPLQRDGRLLLPKGDDKLAGEFVSRVTWRHSGFSGSRQKRFSPVFSVRGGEIPALVAPKRALHFWWCLPDFFFFFFWRLTPNTSGMFTSQSKALDNSLNFPRGRCRRQFCWF